MTTYFRQTGRLQRTLSSALACVIATAPSASTFAQTNAAAMAIRARAEGMQSQGPEGSQPPPGPPGSTPAPGPGPAPPGEASAGMIDTRYLLPNASAVVVVRPAQILAMPVMQALPIELFSATSQKFVGFDLAEMEEIDAFVDLSNMAAPAYAVSFKFKNPIRATSIPLELRAHTQLAELGGKKYLKSAVPTKWSLYGPNNHTLVAATDSVLHQIVENASQPKSGPMMDRLHAVPSGSDLFVSLDVAPLRPFIQMGVAQAQASGKLPLAPKQVEEILNTVSGLSLTLNITAPSPTLLVAHCPDEAGSQKVESIVQEILQKVRAAQQGDPLTANDPIEQAFARYRDRTLQQFEPQRSGTSVTCFHMDGQNAGQRELLAVALAGVGVAVVMPAIQAGRAAARRAQAGPGPGAGPEGAPPPGPGAPGVPGAAP